MRGVEPKSLGLVEMRMSLLAMRRCNGRHEKKMKSRLARGVITIACLGFRGSPEVLPTFFRSALRVTQSRHGQFHAHPRSSIDDLVLESTVWFPERHDIRSRAHGILMIWR